MRECGFSLTRILPYKDRMVDSILIRENAGQYKPVFSHILCSATGKKETRNFWPVINYIQWLILYSHKNDIVLNEWQLLRWKQNCWSSSRSNSTKYKKWIVSAQNESYTFITSQSTLMKRGESKVVGRIFINYGELHDNYQYS